MCHRRSFFAFHYIDTVPKDSIQLFVPDNGNILTVGATTDIVRIVIDDEALTYQRAAVGREWADTPGYPRQNRGSSNL